LIVRPQCALRNEDCSGPLEGDHVGYNSSTQKAVIQQLCRYHNRCEARWYRFFVAHEVFGGRPIPGKLRISLNEWHISHGIHPEFKERIREISEANPLPEDFIPGEGQRQADKAVDEGRSIKIDLMPNLRDGKIMGFLLALPGERHKLIR
jgi:hypothetical protein